MGREQLTAVVTPVLNGVTDQEPPPTAFAASGYRMIAVLDVFQAVGGVRHPQHTQTGSTSSTIAADSSNGVTNNRCCRYSCMLS
jgi:hypothetical protein